MTKDKLDVKRRSEELQESKVESAKLREQRPRGFQLYETPQVLIDAVERRFGLLGFDLAASAEHCRARVAKCHFGPGSEFGEDSLVQDWGDLPALPFPVAWCNPPFADISPWVEKAAECRHLRRWTLLLLPASVDSNWFAEHVAGKAFVMPLAPRVTFRGERAPYTKPIMLLAYGFGVNGFEQWRWK